MPLLILVFVAAVPVIWVTLFVRSHQLFYAFRDRYPEEAKRKIKHAFEFSRHPSKFLYFVGRESGAFLEEKKDGDLQRSRRAVVRLTVAALALPFSFMAVVGLLILLDS